MYICIYICIYIYTFIYSCIYFSDPPHRTPNPKTKNPFDNTCNLIHLTHAPDLIKAPFNTCSVTHQDLHWQVNKYIRAPICT